MHSEDLESALTHRLTRHLDGAYAATQTGFRASTPAGAHTAAAAAHTDRAAHPTTPPNLAAAIRYSLLAPGKRIRPRLLLATARLIGLTEEAALPAALALEMIHCFTLIHDDLPCMDDDDMRRGRPSNHKAHGEALALLAGDALIPLALDTLCEASQSVPPRNFIKALVRFSEASGPRGVIGGQAEELLLTKESGLPQLQSVHRKKTGALFTAALGMACDLGGIDETEPKGRAIKKFADELGQAFQAADDLEDADQAAEPSNILSHLPEREVRLKTATSLRAAMGGLAQAWGEGPAVELLNVAREVLSKVEPQNP